jgi:hypothetical protein
LHYVAERPSYHVRLPTGVVPSSHCPPYNFQDYIDIDADGDDGTARDPTRKKTTTMVEDMLQTCPSSASVTDHTGQLPLHSAIDAYCDPVYCQCADCDAKLFNISHMSYGAARPTERENSSVWSLFRAYPEALMIQDGKTRLYPFIQAGAITPETSLPVSFPHKRKLQRINLTFLILLQDPSLITRDYFHTILL